MIKELEDLLQAQFHREPQKLAKAQAGLAALKAGMDELAALGHRVQIAFGFDHKPEEFPKMFYHPAEAPQGRVIETSAEAEVLPEGWQEVPIGQVKAQLKAEFKPEPEKQKEEPKVETKPAPVLTPALKK